MGRFCHLVVVAPCWAGVVNKCRRKNAGRCGTELQTTPMVASTTLWWVILALDATSCNTSNRKCRIVWDLLRQTGSWRLIPSKIRIIWLGDTKVQTNRAGDNGSVLSVSICYDLGSTICSMNTMGLGTVDPYIKPVRNMAVIPNFFLSDICSLSKTGSGKMKM